MAVCSGFENRQFSNILFIIRSGYHFISRIYIFSIVLPPLDKQVATWVRQVEAVSELVMRAGRSARALGRIGKPAN